MINVSLFTLKSKKFADIKPRRSYFLVFVFYLSLDLQLVVHHLIKNSDKHSTTGNIVYVDLNHMLRRLISITYFGMTGLCFQHKELTYPVHWFWHNTRLIIPFMNLHSHTIYDYLVCLIHPKLYQNHADKIFNYL